MMQRYLFFTVGLSSVVSVVVVVALGWWWREPLVLWLLDTEPAVVTVNTSDAPASTVSLVPTYSMEPIADMVETVNPAVVSIVVTKDVPVYERVYEEYRPFGGAFGGSVSIPRLRESGTETRKVGGGSGFLVSADGLAVTNRHVVSDTSATYSLLFSDGTTAPVDVLARDEVLDIAILQIASTTDRTWPYLPLGNADDLRLGQPVVAIGNALAEFDNTVSSGVISGLSRSITARDQRGGAEQLERVIQTDAAINPGNSGGPLLNLRGEVIGVNVAASLEAQNIGFALPVNAIASVIESVKATGEIVRPFLGVRYRMVTESLVEENNLPITYGAIVLPGADRDQLAVIPGSPAALAGIREGDIILEVNKVSLEERSLASVLREQAVGKTITIKIWRNGTELLRSVTLEAM